MRWFQEGSVLARTDEVIGLKRREFIMLVGGAAAWPLGARAQQAERTRRIGVLVGLADDREGQARVAAFLQGLQQLGWNDGLGMRIEPAWSPPIAISTSPAATSAALPEDDPPVV